MEDVQKKNSMSDPMFELRNLLGPPPVLSSENADHYNEIWERLRACLNPKDFMEELLTKAVVDPTWEAQRYTRNRTLSVERRFRQNLAFQAKRTKAIKQRRDDQVEELAEKTGRPPSDFARLMEIEDDLVSTVERVDEILERIPTEFEHARALEQSIEYQEQLERLIAGALARRDDALSQLEYYREGLDMLLRKESDKIIGAAYKVIEEPNQQIAAPSIVPHDGEGTS